ncbi:hypothetical protein H5410_060990 [Solanum commersonii]|uniref:Uncharacterized protein n=1 Tax=Solanum commersonii TaxID=4109 RepID=A0A9J5W7R9_SOLCO|nr:hypothetical protein H5410_060990 [Solanum commersonii]
MMLNPIYWVSVGPKAPLTVVPNLPPESAPNEGGDRDTIDGKLVVEKRQINAILDQVVKNYHMWSRAKSKLLNIGCTMSSREIFVMRGRIDGLETHFTSRINALSSIYAESLQAQFVTLKADIAKLADKPIEVPLTLATDSLVDLFSMTLK